MRAAVFIDAGYLIKQMQDARVVADYRRLAEYLLEPLRAKVAVDLMRCYFYYCAPWMSENPTEDEKRRMAAHERFLEEIESNDRWEFRLGKLERRRDGDNIVFEQKRVDVMLSVDLVRHAAAGHIQHAVLVAGDSDFIPAIMAAKQSGVTITLTCHEDKSVHKDLIRHADQVRWIKWPAFPKKATNSGTAVKDAVDAAPPAKKPGSRRRRRPAKSSSAEGAVKAAVSPQTETPTATPTKPAASKPAPARRSTRAKKK